jgi:hypothetical protein
MDQDPLKIRLKAKLVVARLDYRHNVERKRVIDKQWIDQYRLVRTVERQEERLADQQMRQLYEIEEWLDKEAKKVIAAGWKLESLVWQLEHKLQEIDPNNTCEWQEN